MSAHDHSGHEHSGPGYASPQAAREQPAEEFLYVAALYEGTGVERPDFIAVVDVDREPSSYGQIVHRTEMPNVGDEPHHFGWNACSSACHSQLRRDTLIVPTYRAETARPRSSSRATTTTEGPQTTEGIKSHGR